MGDATNSPEWSRRIQELMDGTVISHDAQPLNGAVKDSTHTKGPHQSFEHKYEELRFELQRIESEIDTLKAYNKNLELDNARMASVALENQRLSAEVKKVTTALERKILELATVKASTAKTALTAQEAAQEASHTRIQVQELQVKLEAAEQDRDWHRKEHTDMFEARNTHNATCAANTNRLKKSNDKAKKQNEELAKKLTSVLYYMGCYVTDLDLVSEEVRIYKCEHDDISNIPYKVQHTQQKEVWMVSNDIYRQLKDEEGFLNAYMYARQNILDHHRAHEKIGHWKGDSSKQIKWLLKNVDKKRSAVTTYE